jgi:glycosyltransferase involved in cell wall biosynthesis
VLSLAEAFVNNGHETAILELAPTRFTQRRMHPFGGPIWSMDEVICPGRRPRSWVAFLRSLCQFQSIVSQFKPDIVSVQCPSWQSVPVVGACALPHEWRLVVTARGSDIRVRPFVEPRIRPWLNRLFKRADGVTAVSQSLWRDLVDQYPAVRHKGRVIYNGVGPSWCASPGEPPSTSRQRYVFFAGRFHTIKGIDILLRAWKLLRPHTFDIALYLAGEGEELNNMRALSQDLGVAEHVRVVGRVPQRDLPSWYRNAEVVVIPSRNEGLPRVALEAGACGAICVATRVGGIPEVIDDNVTGFLVEPESPDALADALLHALQLSSENRQHMGAAAKQRIQEHFTHERTVTSYENLFRSLLETAV